MKAANDKHYITTITTTTTAAVNVAINVKT
jgi:hypothetical protein